MGTFVGANHRRQGPAKRGPGDLLDEIAGRDAHHPRRDARRISEVLERFSRQPQITRHVAVGLAADRQVAEVLAFLASRAVEDAILRALAQGVHAQADDRVELGQRTRPREALIIERIVAGDGADARQLQRGTRRDDHLQEAEGLVVDLVELVVLAAGEHPFLAVGAVAAHREAHRSIRIQFFTATQVERVAGAATCTHRQAGGDLPHEVDEHHATRALLDHRRDHRIAAEDRRRLRREDVVVITALGGTDPIGVVEAGARPAADDSTAVEALHELRRVAHRAQRSVGVGHAMTPVTGGGDDRRTIGLQRGDHALTMVTAVPHPVDQALVIDLDGDDILAGDQQVRDVPVVDEVIEMVAGCRAFADEMTFDSHAVPVVGGEPQARSTRPVRQRACGTEQTVAVQQIVAMRQCLIRSPCAAQQRTRGELGEIRVADPAGTGEHGPSCGGGGISLQHDLGADVAGEHYRPHRGHFQTLDRQR